MSINSFTSLLMAIVMPLALAQRPQVDPPPAVIAYIFPNDKALDTATIDPFSITRINYAFANINGGRLIAVSSHDRENLTSLVALRKSNPALQIFISVGGWSWSENFSDVALTPESRAQFIESAVSFLAQNNLDGLDVDWEYPGAAGAGNTFRSVDKTNFTLLLKELRARFDIEEKQTHHHWLLSIAVGASNEFLSHTEMSKAQQYLDSINLMAYDYYVPGSDKITGHHAPLYTNSSDPKKISADASVRAFEAAGVLPAKIVLGVPFYGHAWQNVSNTSHGLYQSGQPIPSSYLPYSVIVEKLAVGKFERVWDTEAAAPYLFDPQQQIFITYDDPESIAAKCDYILRNKLGGVMFWDYAGDSNYELLNVIGAHLRPDTLRTEPGP